MVNVRCEFQKLNQMFKHLRLSGTLILFTGIGFSKEFMEFDDMNICCRNVSSFFVAFFREF